MFTIIWKNETNAPLLRPLNKWKNSEIVFFQLSVVYWECKLILNIYCNHHNNDVFDEEVAVVVEENIIIEFVMEVYSMYVVILL